jgi:hypothetical protein
MPSADAVPYPVAGQLYEATVKADALVGTVTPFVPFFNARAESRANYRVLANVSNIGGPIGQGGSTTGKVYFDVVGDVPNSVVFNNGAEDILGWIQPPAVAEELAPPAKRRWRRRIRRIRRIDWSQSSQPANNPRWGWSERHHGQ